jgi:hypothetical protein
MRKPMIFTFVGESHLGEEAFSPALTAGQHHLLIVALE